MEPSQSNTTIGTVQPEGEQDLEVLNSYLTACCFTLLDVNKDIFHKEIHKPENQKVIKNFATERNQRSLMICKMEIESVATELPTAPQQEKTEGEPAHPKELIEFSLEVAYKGPSAHVIAFHKRELYATLDLSSHESSKPIATQIQVINIGYVGEDNTPFVLTNTYIQNSFAPLFHSFESVRYQKGTTEEEDKRSTGLGKVHSKLAELSLAILQCQQNLEIPEIQLSIDQEIRNVVKKAKSENRKVTISDFDEQMKNSEFLNGLQYRANQWVKEIRKVTKITRDCSTGSALQEVNFWLNLEKVLLHSIFILIINSV